MNKQENKKRVLVFEEIGFTDLEGNLTIIHEASQEFNIKNFANGLFLSAKSIDMDDFARAMHKYGEAELSSNVEEELIQVLPSLWTYRVVQAIKETISKL